MTCDKARELATLSLYGELSFADEEQLEEHLRSCPACQESSAQEEKMHVLLSREEAYPPAELLQQARKQLRAQMSAVVIPSPWWRRWLVPSAAWLKPVGALALVAAGFVAARVTAPGPNSISLFNQAPAPVATRVRYVEPGTAGNIQIGLEEVNERTLTGRPDDEQIRRLLLAAAREAEDPSLRQESVGILTGQTDSQEVQNALLFALQHDTDSGVRLKALEGLRPFSQTPETQKALSQVLLSDESPAIRTQAIDLLTQGHDSPTASLLQELLHREADDYVRQRVRKALVDMKASTESF